MTIILFSARIRNSSSSKWDEQLSKNKIAKSDSEPQLRRSFST